MHLPSNEAFSVFLHYFPPQFSAVTTAIGLALTEDLRLAEELLDIMAPHCELILTGTLCWLGAFWEPFGA